MSSYLKKFLVEEHDIIISVIDLKSALEDLSNKVFYYPAPFQYLSKALMGVSLIQNSVMKEEDSSMEMQWMVGGDMGDIVVESSHNGHVRGMVAVPDGKQKPKPELGKGQLYVRKKIKGQVNTGITQADGHLVTDLLTYVMSSEQRDAAINFNIQISIKDKAAPGESLIKVDKAIGYYAELLPKDRSSKELIFWEAHFNALGDIDTWEDKYNKDFDAIADYVGNGGAYKEVQYKRLEFHCHCNKERAERAKALSTPKGVKAEDDIAPLTVRCEFCGTVYSV